MTVIIDPTLSPTTIHVYEAIRTCWLCYGEAPSQYQLQVACRCSNTSVQKSLKVLREKGHILHAKFSVKSMKPVDMERRVYKHAPDPFAELDPDQTRYWKDQ